MTISKPKNFDEYISVFPEFTQQQMKLVRDVINKAAPLAKEIISYGMPALKQKGIVVYYAAHSKHIGFYPKASGILAFQKELSMYKGAKGSVQFPLDKPLPLKLISEIVKFRVHENLNKKPKRTL